METAAEHRPASDPSAGGWLEEARAEVNRALAGLLDAELTDLPEFIAAPIRYAVLTPGKRIRPLLLLATYRACGGGSGAACSLACGVELVHAYSLVHDDLPCMDDDVLRRGRPTVHVRFGVEMAVLTGAALMPLAMSSICRAGRAMDLSDTIVRRLIRELADASGAAGMVGGQLRDLQAEGREVSTAELDRIHLGKTAELIAAASAMGAIAAAAEPALERRMRRFGRKLGLAFQAVDDILDCTGRDGELGKESGRDAVLRKATYPGVLGLPEARRRGRELADAAHREIDGLAAGEPLREIARLVIDRRS